MGNLVEIFNGSFCVPKYEPPQPPEIQLRDAIASTGLVPPQDIIIDGQIHRFGQKTDRSGWYIAFDDGVPSGRFGCWRTGIDQCWTATRTNQSFDYDDIVVADRANQARSARDAERLKIQQSAAETAAKIWDACQPAPPEHPYLVKKNIAPHGARVTGDGRLVLPLYAGDSLSTLQYVDTTGGKLFHAGGKAGESCWIVGDIGQTVYVAEGFATAATIHQITGQGCFVAYSASNIDATARVAIELAGSVTIVGDNDESGLGQKYATQAGIVLGLPVIIPPIFGDANDYALAGHDLAKLLRPPKTDTIAKLQAVSSAEIPDDYTPPDEIVENLLVAGTVAVVYGDSNSGKTFFVLSLAASISEGVPAFGSRTDQGIVVYLATEAAASIKTRIQAIKKIYDIQLENLWVVTVPLNFYSSSGDANDVINLIGEIEQQTGRPVRLVVGDTLARLSTGANENSGEDMGPVLARFDQVIAATGAAVLLIHHTGKNQDAGARGWSGLRAHCDTEILVEEKNGIRSATITKQRELSSKGYIIYFDLETIEMGISKFGGILTTCVAIHIPDHKSTEQEKPTKSELKLKENELVFERAWWSPHGGTEVRTNAPYLSRAGLKLYLESIGKSPRTVVNMLTPSRTDGFIRILIDGGYLVEHEHGWIVAKKEAVSALMLARSMG